MIAHYHHVRCDAAIPGPAQVFYVKKVAKLRHLAVNSSTELPSEWQDGRPPTFNHGLVWRKSEGSAAIAALETATPSSQ